MVDHLKVQVVGAVDLAALKDQVDLKESGKEDQPADVAEVAFNLENSIHKQNIENNLNFLNFTSCILNIKIFLSFTSDK